MTENTSPGMVADDGPENKDAAKMTRADWEAAVAAEREAQNSGNVESNEPKDDIDARIESALAKERAKHAAEMQSALARVPQLSVPAHSGGPGNDNHQISWSLAEQEAAMRGETLSHWS